MASYYTILRIFLQTLSRSPVWIQLALAKLIAVFTSLFATKTKKVVQKNLALCFPEFSHAQRALLAKQYFDHNAKLFMEVSSVWTQPSKKLLQKIEGKVVNEALVSEQGPLIIALPHLGNWELIWPWLCQHKSPMAMYSPAKRAAMDQLVYDARMKIGGEVCATDSKGLLKLLKGVRQGKALIILPDQVPQKGSGVYTPFFGRPAYTMTLLHKLAQKSRAKVILGACVRKGAYFDYQIILDSCENCHWSQDVETFNRRMNEAIESLIRRYPEQYQWSYKRFKRQPDGSRPYDQ